ncbi:MAG: hypothetical protein AB3N28_10745 [Kordiimonas sp.]
MAPKSWAENLSSKRQYDVKPVAKDMAGMKQGQLMLITSPQIMNAFIKEIPVGESIDMKTLRSQLAAKYDAEVCCPITSGIHLRVVAEAAYEEYCKAGTTKDITPFWRAINSKSPTIKKLTFDPEFVYKQRNLEGLES